MVIGNAMTAAAVALNRLGDDVTSSARQIEATWRSARARPRRRRRSSGSLRSGMIALVDSTKTTGLIFFGDDGRDAARGRRSHRRGPPAADPALGPARRVAISSVVAMTSPTEEFFTPAHQLREPPAPVSAWVHHYILGP